MASQFERLVRTAKPHPDESFVGYITRLTDLNYYESPSWIIQLANLGKYRHKESLAFRKAEELVQFSSLTGVNVAQLLGITYGREVPKSNRFGDCQVFGVSVPRTAIRLSQAKICVACLRDDGYIRRIWELTIVTTCVRHKCLLIDRCPQCHQRLSFLRSRLNICRCLYDLRETELVWVEKREMELTQRVHNLCNVAGAPKTVEDHTDLGSLELRDLFQIVSIIASQYHRAFYGEGRRGIDTKGQWLGATDLKDVHRLLCKTMHVFQEWPTNFYAFLDWRRRSLHSKVKSTGIERDFGELWSALHHRPIGAAFDFIVDAFDNYLKAFWQGGHTSLIKRLKGAQTRYVSKPQACKILGVCAETVDHLIESGNLKPDIRPKGSRRLILISITEIDRVRAKRRDLIDRTQAAKRLGISTIQTQVLVRAGLLSEREAYDRRSEVFYSIKEIDALVDKTRTARRLVRLGTGTKIVGFAEALFNLASHHGISVAQFVQAIIDKDIRPCDLKNGSGFRALQFRWRDVIQYRVSVFERRYPDTLNIVQAAKALNTHPKIIPFLIKRRLLYAERVRSRLAIPLNAISDFRSKYVATKALAKQFETSTRYVANILAMEGIEPLPESIVHNAPIYNVFNRSDVDRIKLDELIKAKRQDITSTSRLLDVTAAAQFLHTKPEILSSIAANGILTVRRSRTRQLLYKNCFNETQLCRLLGKVETYVGLVAAKVAAKIFERSISAFNARFVQTNVLAIVYVDGDRTRYFRKSDVEELAGRMKNLLKPSHVRSALKISQSQLFRLVKAGVLKPVCGPNIDKSGLNLFSKDDVEAIRKQRESFKRKRIREGGSGRFGKPAGPQRSPVVDEITPRVRQLITETTVQGNRISGAAIHKQLIKEGYALGINSVYVCLRSERSLGF